jgi:GntR family transcriptional regulator, arabinose operon transcriptional repressor
VPSQRPSTARARLVAELTQEILSRDDQTSFAISSEHQLCRRFNVSRVTVRLALSDLENRGLIYRKHGKGTFAHGHATRIHRHLGILMKSPHATEHRSIAEMVRGAQTAMALVRSAILLISTPPEAWRPEKASSLGGVIVVPQDVTTADLDVLKNRNLPYLIFGESELPGPRVSLGQREAAKHMTGQLLHLGHRRIALLSGYDEALDTPKRMGVYDALRAAGIDPAHVPEISTRGQESGIYQAARDVLHLRPRPTAVVAFDDSLAALLCSQARRTEGIRVPEEMSIISFHDWPYLNCIEPALTTARFEFFVAGQRAADVLGQAALNGCPVGDLNFEPTYRPGQTMAAPPAP